MMMMMMTMTWVFPVKGQWLWFSWNITTDFWRSSVLFSDITCLKFVFWNFSVYLCDTLTTAAPFVYMGSILKNKLVSIGFKKTSRSELFLARKELSNERLQKNVCNYCDTDQVWHLWDSNLSCFCKCQVVLSPAETSTLCPRRVYLMKAGVWRRYSLFSL